MSSKQTNTETNIDIVAETITDTMVDAANVEKELDGTKVYSSRKCLNCGTELNGLYCHNCGQHITDHAMTVKRFILDYLENAFLWDSRIGSTLKKLITRPGILTKEYLLGKFVSQVQPLKLNMFLLLVFITLFVFFGSDQKMSNSLHNITTDERFHSLLQIQQISRDAAFMERIEASPRDTVTLHAPLHVASEYSSIISSQEVLYDTKGEGIDQWIAIVPRVLVDEKVIIPHAEGYYYFNPEYNILNEGLVMLEAIWVQMSQLAVQYFPMIILLTAPFMALSLRLVQRTKKRPFYDHFIFSMHYIAFIELVIILIYILYLVIGMPIDILNALFAISSVTYLTIAFREVYETVWFRSVTKAILSSLIYYTICFAIFGVLILIAIFMVADRYAN